MLRTGRVESLWWMLLWWMLCELVILRVWCGRWGFRWGSGILLLSGSWEVLASFFFVAGFGCIGVGIETGIGIGIEGVVRPECC